MSTEIQKPVWHNDSGALLMGGEPNNFSRKLEPIVYEAGFSMDRGPFLVPTHRRFDFSYKIYGLDRGFVDYVVKGVEAMDENIGVLMNGLKGNGKTVTAKLIANRLMEKEWPTIIITGFFPGMTKWLSQIQQDVVLVFDEFEKMLPKGEDEGGKEMLTLMDGIHSNGNRRVFLLTTNSIRINDNMLDRPKRIRYKKEFGALTKDQIMEIVGDEDDGLKGDIREKFFEKTVQFLSQLQTLTIDIVKEVVKEVNIHEIEPQEFEEIFNVTKLTESYTVYRTLPGETEIFWKSNVHHITLSYPFQTGEDGQHQVGWDFEIDGRGYRYEVKEIVSPDEVDCWSGIESWTKLEDGTVVDARSVVRLRVVKTMSRNSAFYGS